MQRSKASAYDHPPLAERALDAARLAELSADLEAAQDAYWAAQDAYWAAQVETQRRIADAWIAFAEGRTDDAVARMQAAADAEDATDK